MRRPFASNPNMFPIAPVRTDNGLTQGHVGGAAPQTMIQGVRRDIGMVPQFLPQLTVVGGLRQPPRG